MNRIHPAGRRVGLIAALISLFAVPFATAGEPTSALFQLGNLDFGNLDCDDLEAGEHSDAVKRIQRGFLGVELTSLTPELREHFGVDKDRGVMLGRVIDDSAAFRAGLQVGDIVTRVGGETVNDGGDLSAAIRSRGGETVEVEFYRQGTPRTIHAAIDFKETCTFDIGALGIELEGMLHDLPAIQIDALQIGEDAMKEVQEALESVDWKAHMERIQELQGEDFELRMEELHERLEVLQERLEVEYDSYGAELERAMEAKRRAIEAKHRALAEKEHLSDEERREHKAALRTELEHARIKAEVAMEAKREAMEAKRQAMEAKREAEREAMEAKARAAAEEAGEGGTIY